MPPIKGVPVVLGGKNRVLRYTARAFDRLEQETGLSLGQIETRIKMGNFRLSVTVVWLGLVHAEPDLTRDEVLDAIELDEYEQLTDQAGRAMTLAWGVAPSENGASAEGNQKAASDSGS